MKKMKKMMALVIAVVMMMAMSMTTMAAGTLTITVDKFVKGQTYSVYKLFDVTRTDDGDDVLTDENYSYTITSTDSWFDILEDKTKYFTFTQIGTTGVYNVEEATSFNLNNFVSFLKGYTLKPAPSAASITVGDSTTEVKFSNLSPGYYFVDSTLGSLCVLTTSTGNVTISEKNAKPTIEKTVLEDKTGLYGAIATSDINQEVTFKLTVNVGTTIEGLGTGIDKDFLIEDILPNGLTFEGTSVSINYGKDSTWETWSQTDDYSVATEGQKIKITLLETGKLKNAVAEKDIIITYKAKVNGDITIAGDNKNVATLTYGTYVTPQTQANVKSYGIDIFKYTGTSTPLPGATFRLYKMEGGTLKYALITDGKLTGWDNAGTALTSPIDGKLSVDGLDADTYFLEETEAPDGYNKLVNPIKVVISETGTVTYGDAITFDSQNIDASTTSNQIQVENKAGSLLPETGGIGTTIFYAAGALLVIGGVVVLVTRKRMENQ